VHTVVHVPQWSGSIVGSTQTPLQAVRPVGQRHAPLTHAVPPPQALPHAPQFAMSVAMSTQAPEQFI
jgi:hypothetical protein